MRVKKEKKDKEDIKKQQKVLKNYITEVKKSSKCKICGEDRWWVLDFHHIKDKKMPIPEMARNGCSLEELISEIDKCIILCANCHRDIHYQIQIKNEKKM